MTPDAPDGEQMAAVVRTAVAHPRDLVLTAYHEAGHAVWYVSHGRAIRYVTIRSTLPGSSGRTVVHRRREYPDFAALVAYAGPWAEGRAAWMLGPPEDWDAWDDWTRSNSMTVAIFSGGGAWNGCVGSDYESFQGWDLENLSDLADQIMPRLWPGIQAVAAALLASPRALTGREVTALTAAAGVHLLPPPRGRRLR